MIIIMYEFSVVLWHVNLYLFYYIKSLSKDFLPKICGAKYINPTNLIFIYQNYSQLKNNTASFLSNIPLMNLRDLNIDNVNIFFKNR